MQQQLLLAIVDRRRGLAISCERADGRASAHVCVTTSAVATVAGA